MNPLSRESARGRSAGVRLSIMMFLQYAVWGVWLPYLANYLDAPVAQGGLAFSGPQIGWLFGAAASIGALTAPFLAGQIADRFMNAERALALLLVLGGIVKFVTAYQTEYVPWLVLSVLYSVLYMPTLALTNSVAFANLDDNERKFPIVRSLGTVGWIVASVAFPLIHMKSDIHFAGTWPFLDGTPRENNTALIVDALKVSGALSIGYALYCVMVLPSTPPKRDVENPLAFARAFAMFRRADFAVMTVAALLISMIHQVYFMRTGPYLERAIGVNAADVGPIMAIGQVSEIVVLAMLGLFLKRLGYKWVLTLGALSYGVRYGVFALIPSVTTVQAAMLLHGLNYGFFFAGSFLYVDRIAPASIRHSAQTVYGITILGVGPVLAGFYNAQLERLADSIAPLTGGGFNWGALWWAQSAIGVVAMMLIAAAFRVQAPMAEPKLRCSRCGHDHSGGWDRCPECGAPVGRMPVPP